MFVFSLLFFNLPSGSPLVCLLPSFPCNFVIMILTSKVLFFLILSIRKTGIIKTSSFLFQDKNGQQKAGVHVSKLHVHRLLTIPLYYFTNASVSLAIASSSLVGITSTLTLEPGAEITIYCPLFELASSSISIPRNARYPHTFFLVILSFSPTPAVNAMASTPLIAAAYAPTYLATR